MAINDGKKIKYTPRNSAWLSMKCNKGCDGVMSQDMQTITMVATMRLGDVERWRDINVCLTCGKDQNHKGEDWDYS